jgi:hypothetical protein
MRREYTSSDAKDIAHHYNLNLKRHDPLWCPDGSPTTSGRIKIHAKSLSLRGKRLTQIHEENESFLSYFGGYMKNGEAVFKIAVVNLDVADPKELFRIDGAHAIEYALACGVEHVLLSGSSDKAYYARWAEEEAGMTRQGDSPLWVADKPTAQRYIRDTLYR